MIKVIYNKVCGRCVQSEPLTSGMVGLPIHFEYSHDFDGLAVTAVFTDGKNTVDVVNPGNECVIPHEVLTTVGAMVKVGIYAVRGNELVIPTIYATIGAVLKGADPSGDVSADPTLPVWAQIQGIIGDLSELNTEAKNNLVAAINEAAQSGGGGGSTSIAMRVEGGYIQYSTDNGKTWVNLIAESDLKGDTGAPGTPGAPGKDGTSITISGITESTADGGTNTVTFSDGSALKVKNGSKGSTGADGTDGITPHIGDNGNWYIGSTDTGNPSRGATGSQGPAGAPGKDGAGMDITGATVGQIAKITAVDNTGKPTAWVPVDMPDKLPNPNALTFTGAVTGTYDGSAPLEVAIPSGEGGTGGGDNVFELIGEATASGVSDVAGLTIPFDGSLYKTIIAYAYNLPAGNKKRIIIRKSKAWYDGSPLGWNGVVDAYLTPMTNMNNTWGFFGAAIDVGGKLFTLGAAEANANGGHGYFRFSPQNGALPTLSLSDCKFISLDCNSNSEILPDGCSLIVWGVRK